MHYPENIKKIIENELEVLLSLMENEKSPFNKKTIDYYYEEYTKLMEMND